METDRGIWRQVDQFVWETKICQDKMSEKIYFESFLPKKDRN